MYVNSEKEKIDRIIDRDLIGGNIVNEYVIDESVGEQEHLFIMAIDRNRVV